MKIYLLNPPFMEGFVRCGRWQGVKARGKTLYYPIWLAYATGVLEEKGYDVRLVDAIARKWSKEETLHDIKKFSPDMLVVDTNFSSMVNDVTFAVNVKNKLKDSLATVIVGPPAAVYTEKILLELGADIVARKEIDFTLPEIVEVLEKKRELTNVLGISYIKNGLVIHNPERPYLTSEELDNLPFVSKVYKRHLNISDYWLDHTLNPMVQIITSRGCPNLCTFCSWPENLMGRKFRARSAKNIADEIEWILSNLPEVKEVFFEDDAFTINKNRVIEFTKEVSNRNLKFNWSCQARANLDYETMRMMKESGCRLLDVGFESGSNFMLKNMKKGLTVERAKKFAADAKRAGLLILADFMFGLPGETHDTMNQTIKFIKEIKPNLLQIAVATPIPGTQFYELVKEKGYLLEDDPCKTIDDNGFQKCLVSYPNLSSQDIGKAVDNALKSYYLSVSYIPVALSNVFRKNGMNEFVKMMESARVFLGYLRRNK